jgi:hypothetical protein
MLKHVGLLVKSCLRICPARPLGKLIKWVSPYSTSISITHLEHGSSGIFLKYSSRVAKHFSLTPLLRSNGLLLLLDAILCTALEELAACHMMNHMKALGGQV